jgi:hypothetical protein
MTRIIFLILLGALVWFVPAVGVVWAETPSSPPQKDLKLSTSKPAVTPLPEPPVLEKDADQVAAGIEQRARDEKLIREEIIAPHRRPDLEYDVVNAIQSRNADKALRRH